MIHPFKHRGINRDVKKIQDQMILALTNLIGMVPGADTMAYAIDDDGMTDGFWRGLTNFKIDMDKGWTPEFVGRLLRVEISTIVEWYAQDYAAPPMDLKDGINWFLKYESFYGIDRRVFKQLEPEKIEAILDAELAANGEVVWPVIVHILKARKFVVENHHYELEHIDDESFRITGVDPNVKGYYTIDFRFRGKLEDALLRACLKEDDDAPAGS